MRLRILSPIALAAVVAACTNASPDESGGDDRFDASPPPVTDQTCAGDPSADAGSGHAFGDLYRDYFGPTAKSSCAGTSGSCHGSADALGAQSSGGYVCGATADACYQGMVAAGFLQATSPPENNLLYQRLRRCNQVGNPNQMPQSPSDFVFYASDLKRVADWLSEGAKNN